MNLRPSAAVARLGMAPSLVFVLLAAAGVAACSASTPGTDGVDSADAPGATGTGGTGVGSTTGSNEVGGFMPSSSGGSTSSGTGGACSQMLYATIRDFSSAHPDFGHFAGSGAFEGIVQEQLGADDKPTYAAPGPTDVTTGPNEFHDWYNDTSGVNLHFEITLQLEAKSPGTYAYDSSAFFPIDGQGYGDEGNAGHNFYFTTEVHTEFAYQGGEHFTFTGDDDLWVFVNDRLAIDLGGPHGAVSSTADFDAMASELGITPGKSYAMSIFHAERAVFESNFHIETNIECFDSQAPK